MMLVTIPVFFPLILRLDFGMPHEAVAVWFGILVLILIEVGQITPPIGLNVYVINSMAKDVPMTETFAASSRSSCRTWCASRSSSRCRRRPLGSRDCHELQK